MPARKISSIETVLVVGLAACYPAGPPTAPRVYAPVIATRVISAAVLSRYDAPVPEVERDLAVAAPIERQTLVEPPSAPLQPVPPSPLEPKTEVAPAVRETLAPPPVQEHAAMLPDEVVLRLLETGRAIFVRCFKKAVASDPAIISFKVRVHVELDGGGAVVKSSADSEDDALGGCLVRGAGWLRYPATGERVVVELPLFYRTE